MMMNMREELLKETAKYMVEDAVTNYAETGIAMFMLVLNGVMKYKLELKPGAGHNYGMILDAIYDYYRNDPTSQIDQMLFNTLIYEANNFGTFPILNIIMNYVYLQLRNEKNYSAPFKLNIHEILNCVKKQLTTYEKFKDDPRTATWLEETDRIFQERYHYKML